MVLGKKQDKDLVRITVDNYGRIPTIGKGPITRPILIEKDTAEMLIKSGYKVIIHEDPRADKVSIPDKLNNKESNIIDENKVIIEEPIMEDEKKSNNKESNIIDENKVIIEEPIMEDDEESLYTEEELKGMNNKELKEICKLNNISFSNSNSNNALIKLILSAQNESINEE